MALMEDFKKFAFKGNVVDLAVGVIIGAGFGKIVTALVADIVMPFVALFMPKGDWRDNVFYLRGGPDQAGSVAIKYGDFLGAVLDFFVVAFVLFIIVSKVVKAAEGRLNITAAPTTKECPQCLETIPIGAKRCKFCTSDLSKPVSVAS
jgi:large conductance mechanosensitive channel